MLINDKTIQKKILKQILLSLISYCMTRDYFFHAYQWKEKWKPE